MISLAGSERSDQPSAKAKASSCALIRRALDVLFEPGAVVELRVPDAGREGTISGYYSDFDRLAADAAKLDGMGYPGIYVTLNVVKPELLARAANRYRVRAKTTTQDSEILRRRWILLDFDPVRPVHISSTDAELRAAAERARACWDWLVSVGIPETALVGGLSGNGVHILIRVDWPANPETDAWVNAILQAVALRFSDETVAVDTAVGNRARLVKLPGTTARKGDHTPERPHRRSRLTRVPERLAPAAVDTPGPLQAVIDLGPRWVMPGTQEGLSAYGFRSAEDVERWLEAHGLAVAKKKAWQGGTLWELETCPNSPAHRRTARVIRLPNGALSFGCFHNSCAGLDWRWLRDKVEPAWRQRLPRHMRPRVEISANGHASQAPALEEIRLTAEWPDPPATEAFYGLAGDAVRAVEPYTEADPVALLGQFVVAFGVTVGRQAYFPVGADRHYLNLFLCLVGPTAKGRKGSAWRFVASLFDRVEPHWSENRVASGLSSGEGLIWAVRNPVERQEPIRDPKTKRVVEYQTVVEDAGVTDKRLLVLEEEFSSPLKVMAREGNTLSPVIRRAWDTGNLRTLTKNSPVRATGAHIGIIGHATLWELRKDLNAIEAANGFANRFLWLLVRRSKELPDGGEPPESVYEELATRLRAAVEFAKAQGRLQRDEEASDAWRAVYSSLSEDRPGLLGAILNRAEAIVVRLSCLYALLDRSPLVRLPHLRAALALWEYAEASARFIFGESLGDPDADALWQELRSRPEGMTTTQIHEFFGRNKTAAELQAVLGRLMELGRLRCLKLPAGGPGRPAQLWLPILPTGATSNSMLRRG